jgi:multiple sugar transport system permease protein
MVLCKQHIGKIRKEYSMNKKNNIILCVVAVLIACVFLFPLYWIIVNSFKLDSEIFASTPTLWPKEFTLKAYQEQFGNLFITVRNSIIIALGSMVLSLILSVPAAYGLARFKVRGMKLFILVFLITQMLPASLVLTPLYLIFSKLGILNTYFAPILSTATISIPFIVLMLRPGFLSMPKELEDAAMIDGCNGFTTFLRIAIPISKPTVITATCFSFVFAWNDLAYSMTFNTKEIMRPMTSAIYTFMNQYGTQWNSIMAYGVLLILPSCFIFVTMQKHIVEGMTSGSVKG